MADLSEPDWRNTLISILEQLDKEEYQKLLLFLDKIPKCYKERRSNTKMADKILKYFGLEQSISIMKDTMEKIPRKDGAVQDRLRPFVEKLDQARGQKRSCSPGGVKVQNSSQHTVEESASAPSSSADAKSAFRAKVITKSEPRACVTQTDEKTLFFRVTAANESGRVEMTVYGKEHHLKIQPGGSYLFQDVIKEEGGGFKVTRRSKVCDTTSVSVPEEVEAEAREPQAPVKSISAVKSFPDQTEVSVRGVIKQVDLVESVKVKYQREKVKKQEFYLENGTDSIKICTWKGKVEMCKGFSFGDEVKITNLKVKRYKNEVSLNSTPLTRVHKIHSVGIRKMRIQITAIQKALKTETHLKAEVKGHLHTFVVSTKLLLREFGLKCDDRFKENLLKKLPLSPEVEIEGVRILKIWPA